MPGEVSDRVFERANNSMAASPFDSPEVAARFNSSVGPWNAASPSPHPKVPAVTSRMSPWNVGPLSAMANGRAVSAGRVYPPAAPVESHGRLANDEDLVSSQLYWDRYTQVKSFDGAKNQLVEDLLVQNLKLTQQLKQFENDYEREVEYNRGSQKREKLQSDEIRQMKACFARDPYITVIIDGNNLAFKPSFLARGESGGCEVAAVLRDALINRIRQQTDESICDLRVTVRVYADLKRLGELYCNAGFISEPSAINDFTRGFIGSHSLFEVIDMRNGRITISQRMQDILDMHMHDTACRQIFLGGVCDQALLQKLETDEHALDRITLLGGPAEDDSPLCSLDKLNLRRLFRDPSVSLQTSGGSSSNLFSPNTSGLPTPPPSMPAISRQLSEISVKDIKDFQPSSRPMTKSCSTTSTTSSPKPSPAVASVRPSLAKASMNSWASLAAKPPPVAPPVPVVASKIVEPDAPSITRNRRNQRVDPAIKHDKTEVDRVKKLKMCNVHYLRDECGYGDDCSHSHKHKPTKEELRTLSLVARMAPCTYGSDCEDAKCIYGHICPAPEGRNGEDCIFGKTCRFPETLHKVDRTVVKTIKVW